MFVRTHNFFLFCRHHVEVLYGGAGANSLLTPSSLLCQLMDNAVAEHEVCNEYEALFVRLERDARQAVALAAGVTDKLGRELQFLSVPLHQQAAVLVDAAVRGTLLQDEGASGVSGPRGVPESCLCHS